MLAPQELRDCGVVIEARAQNDGVAERPGRPPVAQVRPAASDKAGQNIRLAAITVQKHLPHGGKYVEQIDTKIGCQRFEEPDQRVLDLKPQRPTAAPRMQWPRMVCRQIQNRRSPFQLLSPKGNVSLALRTGEHPPLPFHEIAVFRGDGKERMRPARTGRGVEFQ